MEIHNLTQLALNGSSINNISTFPFFGENIASILFNRDVDYVNQNLLSPLHSIQYTPSFDKVILPGDGTIRAICDSVYDGTNISKIDITKAVSYPTDISVYNTKFNGTAKTIHLYTMITNDFHVTNLYFHFNTNLALTQADIHLIHGDYLTKLNLENCSKLREIYVPNCVECTLNSLTLSKLDINNATRASVNSLRALTRLALPNAIDCTITNLNAMYLNLKKCINYANVHADEVRYLTIYSQTTFDTKNTSSIFGTMYRLTRYLTVSLNKTWYNYTFKP